MGCGHASIAAGRGFIHGLRRKIRGRFSFLTLIVAVASGIFATGARANELSLLINGKAIHINAPSGENLNESNWGAGFQYDWTSVYENRWVPFVMASGFSDSNSNPSYYAGGGVLRRFETDNGLRFDIGAIGFAMTRKGYKDDKPFLGALPAFSAGTKNFAVNMTYIPKVDPKMVALFFFQLKINMDVFH
jgi:hypothetical protein